MKCDIPIAPGTQNAGIPPLIIYKFYYSLGGFGEQKMNDWRMIFHAPG
jgi:hypothetical protein